MATCSLDLLRDTSKEVTRLKL